MTAKRDKRSERHLGDKTADRDFGY